MFVPIFEFEYKGSPVSFLRELSGPDLTPEQLRQLIQRGDAAPVKHGSYSVQYAGNGKYFDDPHAALYYLLDHWRKEVFRALGISDPV